ncbi:ABC transporter (arginine-binding protein) [Alkalihalophilus pseudofirmus OF4]|uniref:ABC transporter (Arginine-binding protein) n=1 Tax=Alkalihalophilus pseudofirmus (strain ATCC BAA-2126 / JCM 17055 / OF4) TaxID=398511 RepID=D3FYP9_ALKPO|nr:transporter substrate-binding domain-containing protein [Alkalihalophilus pseudofirmus]ADC50901.1 ABC transporter (arginine-binding protein) [Alkalihalophilus pseudofirmus OF4]
MKKYKWSVAGLSAILSVGLSAILSVGLLAGCGAEGDGPAEVEAPAEEPTEEVNEDATSGEGGTLIMATSADYPPYESVDLESGEIVGFDIDIANHIASELGYELEIQDVDFNGLIPAMEAGRADFVLAGMTPTEERKENVDFSDIYYEAQNLIVSKEDQGLSAVEDLEGLTVGVQLGSIQEGEAEDLAEEIGFNVEKRDRIPELIQELLAGRLDAILMEDTVAAGYMESQSGLAQFEVPSEELAGSAIAFPKGSELVEPFNDKLNEMIDSGLMDELIIKWFDAEE